LLGTKKMLDGQLRLSRVTVLTIFYAFFDFLFLGVPAKTAPGRTIGPYVEEYKKIRKKKTWHHSPQTCTLIINEIIVVSHSLASKLNQIKMLNTTTG